MNQMLTPAQVVLMRFGSKERIAEAVGRHRTTVSQWWHAKPTKRAGDIPTADAQRRLLTYARQHDIPLTAEELIFGAKMEIVSLDSDEASPIAAE